MNTYIVYTLSGELMREFILSRHFSISSKESACLAALYASQYESRKAVVEPAVKGTYEWILRHETFLQWLDDAATHSLWISRGPGCGKSVLTSFLIRQPHVKAFEITQPSVENSELLCATRPFSGSFLALRSETNDFVI
jgi:hypothetical protein